MSNKQLMRSEDRMVAGVAGGLAEYFDIDPTIIRILFVLLALFGGGFLGILIYIVLWIIMPDPLDAS
jgi:phage shock protein C